MGKNCEYDLESEESGQRHSEVIICVENIPLTKWGSVCENKVFEKVCVLRAWVFV